MLVPHGHIYAALSVARSHPTLGVRRLAAWRSTRPITRYSWHLSNRFKMAFIARPTLVTRGRTFFLVTLARQLCLTRPMATSPMQRCMPMVSTSLRTAASPGPQLMAQVRITCRLHMLVELHLRLLHSA